MSAVEAPAATIDHDTAVSMVKAIFGAVMTASASAIEDVVGQAVADLEEDEALRGGLPHYRRYGSWEAEHWQALAGPFRREPEEEM